MPLGPNNLTLNRENQAMNKRSIITRYVFVLPEDHLNTLIVIPSEKPNFTL